MIKVPVRVVHLNNTVYIRTEDVAAYLSELGGSEETDVRERLEEAADYFNQVGEGKTYAASIERNL